jgi:hypothetical protein
MPYLPPKKEGEKLFESDVQGARKDLLVLGRELVTSEGSNNEYELVIDRNADDDDNNNVITSADLVDGFQLRFKADRTSDNDVTITLKYSDGGGGTIATKDAYLTPTQQASAGDVREGNIYRLQFDEDIDGFILNDGTESGGADDIIDAILEEDMTAGTPVGISHYLSQTTPHIARARFGQKTIDVGEEPYVRTVLPLDNNRVFILFGNASISTSNLKAVIGTFNHNTNTLTLGTIVTVSAGTSMSAHSCDLIDTDKVAINYVLAASDTIVRCKIAEVAGTAITLSSEQDVITLGSAMNLSGTGTLKTKAIDTNKVAVYAVTNIASNTRVVVYTVSGTTITAGTGAQPGTNLRGPGAILTRLDTDKFVLVTPETDPGNSQVGEVTGTTITLGSEETFTTGGTSTGSAAVQVDTDKILVTYNNTTGTNPKAAKVITYSGDAIDVEGTPVDISVPSINANGIGLIRVSSSKVIGSDSANRTYREFNISGTALTTTLIGRSLDFGGGNANGTGSGNVSGAILDNRILNISRSGVNTLRYTSEGDTVNLAGVLLQDGDRGDTRRVKLHSNIMESNLSLKGGEFYRLGGTLSAQSSGNGTLNMISAVDFPNVNLNVGLRNGEFLAIDENRFIKL